MKHSKTRKSSLPIENAQPHATLDPVLRENLNELRLNAMAEELPSVLANAATENLTPLETLAQLINLQVHAKRDKAALARVKAARLPLIKTLANFDWTWPRQIDRLAIEHHFGLAFLDSHQNIILLGPVGVGKTHLAIALGYHAASRGRSVYFAGAIEIINHLDAAQKEGSLHLALRRYLKTELLIIDELGFLPIDSRGADLLFQVISRRYESGSIILTSNRGFPQWPDIFNNDSTITSAVLDRLLHHSNIHLIDANTYRMKDRVE